MIAVLLKRARKLLRGQVRPDPWATAPELETAVRGLFEAHRDAVEWPGKRDPEVFVQAALILLEAADGRGRQKALEAVADVADWECACRCRAHTRVACVKCVATESCPRHGAGDSNE